MERGNGIDEDIDTLHRSELADEDDVGRVRGQRDGAEFRWADAVVDHTHGRMRRADLVAEDPRAERTLEQIEVAARHQQALQGEISLAGECRVIEQQAAAVRRISAHDRRTRECKARIGAALGAMAMHDLRSRRAHAASDMHQSGKVARAELARHRDRTHAEGEMW